MFHWWFLRSIEHVQVHCIYLDFGQNKSNTLFLQLVYVQEARYTLLKISQIPEGRLQSLWVSNKVIKMDDSL